MMIFFTVPGYPWIPAQGTIYFLYGWFFFDRSNDLDFFFDMLAVFNWTSELLIILCATATLPTVFLASSCVRFISGLWMYSSPPVLADRIELELVISMYCFLLRTSWDKKGSDFSLDLLGCFLRSWWQISLHCLKDGLSSGLCDQHASINGTSKCCFSLSVTNVGRMPSFNLLQTFDVNGGFTFAHGSLCVAISKRTMPKEYTSAPNPYTAVSPVWLKISGAILWVWYETKDKQMK